MTKNGQLRERESQERDGEEARDMRYKRFDP